MGVGEDDLKNLFDNLPKDGESKRQALLTNEEFRDAVLKSLSCKRRFDLMKFVRLLDQTSDGFIAVKDWDCRCQATLGLERDTIVQMFTLAETGARLDKRALSTPRKSPPGYIHEEDLIAFLDHPQVRRVFCWERGMDDEDDGVDAVSGVSDSRCSSTFQLDVSSLGRDTSYDTINASRTSLDPERSFRRNSSKELARPGGVGHSQSQDSLPGRNLPGSVRRPGSQSQSVSSLRARAEPETRNQGTRAEPETRSQGNSISVASVASDAGSDARWV